MELNNDLITQFAKITKFNAGKSATTVRGTIRKSEDRSYIQIDGADEGSMTPVETVVEVSDGDRVIATVKDHSVIVTGNKTDPSVGTKTADGLRSSITQTADQIRLEVANEVKGLNSSLTLTAEQIRSEVNDEVNKLNSSITQTAGQIRSEVNDGINGVNSSITQTASSIRSEVADSINGVNTKITQTADAIKSEVISTVDGKYSEVKQTVDGLTITTVNGKTTIDGGNISTTNLNLTGAITWSDLSSSAQSKIEGVADDAYELAEKAYNLADGNTVTLPTYIKSTYIDSTTIKSPNIIGGQLYAVGSDPEESSTFTTMDENGFYLYSDAVESDINNEVYPKISMICDTGYNATPMIILGSGESDEHQYHNRFVIEKGTSYVDMMYIFNYSYPGSGFTFNRDGTIKVYGELRGTDGLFPIGYVYLSFDNDDDNSPMSLFGGTWTRLEGYFLYAGGSSATMHDTGNVVTAGGTNTAKYIKLAAWERVA